MEIAPATPQERGRAGAVSTNAVKRRTKDAAGTADLSGWPVFVQGLIRRVLRHKAGQ